MKLYLISQDQNYGWDTYDSAVVIAPDEEAARNTYPGEHSHAWTEPENVRVRYLGESVDDTPGVVCASYNAG